ncbi:MAG: response regulator [Planctomycetota bacterium]
MEHTILVVDDEEKITRILCLLLEHNGFKVLAANHADEALTMLKDNKVDLVLTDIMMPDVNGYELAQKIKDDPATAHIPLMFLSAKSEAADKFTGYFVGAAEYITKPFESEELLSRVKRVLDVDELERSFQMDMTTPLRRGGDSTSNAPAAVAAAPSVSFARIGDILQLYDAALKIIHAKATELIGASAVDRAFVQAINQTIRKFPVLQSLQISPDGLDTEGATALKQTWFEEANIGLSELLRHFFSNIMRKKGKAKQGIQVLILNSDGETFDFYKHIIENAGFNALLTNTIEEARALLKSEIPPDIMLVDTSPLQAEDQNELEISHKDDAEAFLNFYRETQKEFPDLDIPILILADKHETATVLKSIVAGAGDYLVKPFTSTELVTAIVALLRSR